MKFKILKRFYLKPNSNLRDYIGIMQTNECYIIPLFSVVNIMRQGNSYIRFGWLFWYLEYYKDLPIYTGYNGEESIGNTIGTTNNEN